MNRVVKSLKEIKKTVKNKTPDKIKIILDDQLEKMQQELEDKHIKQRLKKAKKSIEKILSDVKKDDTISQGTYDSIFQILELAVGIREENEDKLLVALEKRIKNIEDEINDIHKILDRIKLNRTIK